MDRHAGTRVIFVGKRPGALAAARRLGLDVVLWSERGPKRADSPTVVHWEPLAAERSLADAAEVAERLAGQAPVAAVLALAEGTVPAAAALRGALGLDGTSLETALCCADKQLMKQTVEAAGVPCAPFATAAEGLSRAALVARLGLPMIVKPRVGWGGRGSVVLRRPEEVPELLPVGFLAEGFVSGVEMSTEALVDGGRRLFTNPTEYLEPGWANVVPRDGEPGQRRQAEDLLDRALAALEIERGIVHFELFLTPTGPVFGELANRPAGGHILRLIELAYGFDLWEAWLRLELGERPPLPERSGGYAGVRLLYPGAGRVERVDGLERARQVPGIVEATVRVKPGKELPPRIGVGQEAGRLVAAGPDRASVVTALETARRLVTIELAAG